MRFYEKFIEIILFLFAITAVVTVLLITFFVFKEGLPIIFSEGILNFVASTEWAPLSGKFGILSMILGSVQVTLGAIILGVPIGVACAVYLAEIADKHIAQIVRPGIELLAGIDRKSVV